MALKGKTPAEMAGIIVEGSDEWLTIIQSATHVPKVDSSTKEGDVPET